MPGRPPRLHGSVSLACGSLLLALLAPGGALAAGGAPGVTTDRTPLSETVRNGAADAAKHSSGTGGAFVRLVVGLFIVLAVIYGVYWLLKTYGKSRKGRGAAETGPGIDVVATTAIGPNRALHLVRVGDELVLVGAAEQSIARLRVYSAEESRRLEQQIDAAGGMRVLADRTTGGAPPLVRLVDKLRKRTLR